MGNRNRQEKELKTRRARVVHVFDDDATTTLCGKENGKHVEDPNSGDVGCVFCMTELMRQYNSRIVVMGERLKKLQDTAVLMTELTTPPESWEAV